MDASQRVTKHNVVQAYHDWIVVALERWKEHTRVYRGVGQKPVLFIMCERTAYADAIAEHIRKYARLRKKEVLVIHTDSKGNITKKDLDQAREAARDVDEPDSDVKIIVSVLMLREGWDVRNVTVTLGLRPFTSKAAILPEQAVGRGLRVMHGISPDRRQTLEVIGTEAFEAFVRELEQEGVGIDTVGTPPPLPVNWIVETKGREYEEVAHKDASIRDWCEKISAQTGQTWRYLKVPQKRFDASDAETFGELRVGRECPSSSFAEGL